MDNSKELLKLKNFQQNAKKCFDTEAGKLTLAYLKLSYIDTSALGSDPYDTYYKMGQQDLIKELVALLSTPEVLEEIIVNNYSDEDYI